MEVFADSRGEGESPRGTVDFKKFIRQIEANCERTLLHRKNKLLFRQKLKENWLTRTKIIPPSFPQLPSSPTPSDPPSPTALRPACKTSHALRQVASCDRLKSTWKLQFRRDELNILKYVLPAQKRGLQQSQDRSSSAKSFKVRRLQRKFEQILPFHRTYLSPDDRPLF